MRLLDAVSHYEFVYNILDILINIGVISDKEFIDVWVLKDVLWKERERKCR
jgi:hypothetical protein